MSTFVVNALLSVLPGVSPSPGVANDGGPGTSPDREVRSYGHHLRLPLIGEVAVPPPDKLAYYGGIGALAALQVIEWPVALVITAGHLLADQHLSGLARGLGEALETT